MTSTISVVVSDQPGDCGAIRILLPQIAIYTKNLKINDIYSQIRYFDTDSVCFSVPVAIVNYSRITVGFQEVWSMCAHYLLLVFRHYPWQSCQ